jgi:hypothetical protein
MHIQNSPRIIGLGWAGPTRSIVELPSCRCVRNRVVLFCLTTGRGKFIIANSAADSLVYIGATGNLKDKKVVGSTVVNS